MIGRSPVPATEHARWAVSPASASSCSPRPRRSPARPPPRRAGSTATRPCSSPAGSSTSPTSCRRVRPPGRAQGPDRGRPPRAVRGGRAGVPRRGAAGGPAGEVHVRLRRGGGGRPHGPGRRGRARRAAGAVRRHQRLPPRHRPVHGARRPPGHDVRVRRDGLRHRAGAGRRPEGAVDALPARAGLRHRPLPVGPGDRPGADAGAAGGVPVAGAARDRRQPLPAGRVPARRRGHAPRRPGGHRGVVRGFVRELAAGPFVPDALAGRGPRGQRPSACAARGGSSRWPWA